MTEQIKYKIGEQEVSVEYDEYGSTRITRELLEDLIKSRCAWSKVLQELEDMKKELQEVSRENWDCKYDRFTINAIIDIINQHLEIEEVR